MKLTLLFFLLGLALLTSASSVVPTCSIAFSMSLSSLLLNNNIKGCASDSGVSLMTGQVTPADMKVMCRYDSCRKSIVDIEAKNPQNCLLPLVNVNLKVLVDQINAECAAQDKKKLQKIPDKEKTPIQIPDKEKTPTVALENNTEVQSSSNDDNNNAIIQLKEKGDGVSDEAVENTKEQEAVEKDTVLDQQQSVEYNTVQNEEPTVKKGKPLPVVVQKPIIIYSPSAATANSITVLLLIGSIVVITMAFL